MSKEQMTSADAAWLHMDRPTNLMVVNSVLWFDEPMNLDRARDVIREHLVERFPRFRQRVAEPRLGVGVPSWEDDPSFDLDRHVHHLALPAPGDQPALHKLVGDLISSPLDRAKPLWDIYLIDGYRAGMALVARMHHSIADGIALARVLLSMTDAQPDAGIAPATRGDSNRRIDRLVQPVNVGVHMAQDAMHEGFKLLRHPLPQLQDLAAHAVTDTRALRKLLLTPAERDSALRGELGARQKVGWIDQVALADVKAIGRATGTTVNDVLVAATTGALSRSRPTPHAGRRAAGDGSI